MIKHKGSQNFSKLKLSPKYYQNNNKIRNAVTPTRKISKYALTAENWTKKRNYKYNYVKSRYMDETNKISESNMKKNKSKKLKDIKLKKDNKQKNSKSKSNKTSTKNQENNLIIEKSSSTRTQKESKNKFYIQRDNKRLETLMNVLTESSSS